jgi:hypothetical protein
VRARRYLEDYLLRAASEGARLALEAAREPAWLDVQGAAEYLSDGECRSNRCDAWPASRTQEPRPVVRVTPRRGRSELVDSPISLTKSGGGSHCVVRERLNRAMGGDGLEPPTPACKAGRDAGPYRPFLAQQCGLERLPARTTRRGNHRKFHGDFEEFGHKNGPCAHSRGRLDVPGSARQRAYRVKGHKVLEAVEVHPKVIGANVALLVDEHGRRIGGLGGAVRERVPEREVK